MVNNWSASSFTASSTPIDIHNSSDSEDDSAQSDTYSALHPIPAKKLCTSSQLAKRCSKSHPMSDKHRCDPKWEQQFTWLEYFEDHQGAFCKLCKKEESLERTGGA